MAPANDSFIGEGLVDSPYVELQKKYNQLLESYQILYRLHFGNDMHEDLES